MTRKPYRLSDTINRDQKAARLDAFRNWCLDHYAHFEIWPLEFEFEDVVYDYDWIWDTLTDNNFFKE